jgi:hypothetical protein
MDIMTLVTQAGIEFDETSHRYTQEDTKLSKKSVTKIAGMADSSDGLTRWKCRLAAQTALLHEGHVSEGTDDFSELVEHYSNEGDRQGREASDLGTRIHKLIELHIKNKLNPEGAFGFWAEPEPDDRKGLRQPRHARPKCKCAVSKVNLGRLYTSRG